ncbi:alpha/beta-hydrolase [Lenzites betulinus]|nr:alpha/beta-hydrolase [Lenzites betulinus]
MLEETVYNPPERGEGEYRNAWVRYRLPPNPEADEAKKFEGVRLSLILLHAVAAHSEIWIPMLEDLFTIQRTTPTNAFTVVEAWSLEAPNHGRAAVLNEKLLPDLTKGITGVRWANLVKDFMQSGLAEPGTRFVSIGHSAGTSVAVQCADGFPLNRLPVASMILIEPPMMTPEGVERATEAGAVLMLAPEIAAMRKDIWPSREAARTWLAKRYPWRRWDPRVLDLYVKHGLRDLPTVTYPDKEGVTLTHTRVQESTGYTHHADAFISLERLKEFCSIIPVHCIFGQNNEMVPEETQAEITNEKVGRKMRSIVRLAKTGHLAVQENPRGVALAIWGIFHEDFSRPSPRL